MNGPICPKAINSQADAEMKWLIQAITDIRSVRAEMNVPAGAQIPLIMVGAQTETQARLERLEPVLKRLARLSDVHLADSVPQGAVANRAR